MKSVDKCKRYNAFYPDKTTAPPFICICLQASLALSNMAAMLTHDPAATEVPMFLYLRLCGYDSNKNTPKTKLHATHLEASGSRFARRYISVIVNFKFRHHSDDCLDDKGNDVRPHLLNVYTFSCQPVQHAGESALAACALAV